MDWNSLAIFPVMGQALTTENTLPMDFSAQNQALQNVDLANTEVFDRFVFSQLEQEEKVFGIGGYLENRAIYQRSEVFATEQSDFRNIHLGIDIWCKAWTPVYAPLVGKIHSFQDNAGFGNYGATLILEHDLGEKKLYSLYGHLAQEDLKEYSVGKEVKKGDPIAHVGPFPENGDWPPHLHFQLMWDMEGNWGDYPGVCSQREKEHYAANCPDPNLILRFPS
ncbi:peptidoglycan DD-metalloendopeptidase family protein [Algoriphagus limi]|uniref:Peptidoglycan DD-metalloendopeptidase family protein n=1 Tax=Algoriphagus limi TaxID=2975273 RepID=A0ABT2G6R3_9BACT|nr:peptidoglycan DD-metalloendopeptidase family protein [Algoriphagus limi]MCS5490812.1 peptidoglycan DD-metalloendopeptidase family protein [Algoriphagus limi]